MLLKVDKGFTLIEALASTIVLSILVISFMSFSGFSVLAGNKSNHIIEASRIAEQQLNIARYYIHANNSVPADPIEAGYVVTLQTTDLVNPANYMMSSYQPNHTSLQAIVLIDAIPKILTVTVSWSSS